MRTLLTICLLLLVSGDALYGQFGNFPMENDYSQIVLKGRADYQYNFHSSLKPYTTNEIDSLDVWLSSLNFNTKSKAKQILFNAEKKEDQQDKIHLNISPIINVMYGQGTSNDTLDRAQLLGLGLNIYGFAGKKLTFGLDYTYSSAQYADYVEEHINRNGMVPGMGEAYSHGDFINNKFYSGYISYSPIEFLNLQAGKGKHFIGNGYRSLLLSDNSTSYPYFKMTINIWKIKYQVLYSYMKAGLGYTNGNIDFQDKFSTSNLLSMNIGKNLNVGLFQSVVWYNNPESNRGFDVNYMNPFIFLRPVEFSIGSPDNVLMGMDLKYNFFKKYTVYGQIVLDEFLLNEVRANNGWWGNKYGYQIGFKTIDILGIRGLSALFEHNYVRPYTYSHSQILQNYSNSNEALAHTLGANFKELIGRISYSKNRWLFSANAMIAKKGEDGYPITSIGPDDGILIAPNNGGDIFKSNKTRVMDYNNVTGQGFESTIMNYQFKVGYLVNPEWKLIFEIGVSQRTKTMTPPEIWQTSPMKENNNMIFIGLRTALYNQYFDF